jgi:hypothetical protein
MLGIALLSVTALLLIVGQASAADRTFSNTTGITIADATASGTTQEESDITASGVVGNISKVTATLNGFAHACPIDADVMLIGPLGQKSILMSDIGDCKSAARAGVNLTFDDAALNGVPCILSGGAVTNTLPAGTYKPTDASPTTNGGAVGCDPPLDTDHAPNTNPNQTPPGSRVNVFNLPLPTTGPFPTGLATFAGGSPNGTWKLLVVDQYPGDSGSISGGWTLNFNVAPPTLTNPSITGAAQAGQLLTANSGTVTGGGAPTYQWNHCSVSCAPIAGATGATYVPQTSDVNAAITVTEFVTNDSKQVVQATSAPTATIAAAPGRGLQQPNTATVSLSGTKSKQKVVTQGGVLTSFTSSADGSLVATGTVSVPKLAKTYRFKTVKATVRANNRTTIQLKLPSSALKAIKKALAKHKHLSAKITLTVTTAGGAKTTVHKTIKLA